MKVILSAFQGKLKSEPIDMPEGTGMYLDLMLAIDPYFNPYAGAVPKLEVVRKKGRFARTDKHIILPNNETAVLYELVGI